MKSEMHKQEIPMRQNSDDGKDGGLTRSSDEAFVMKVEQRG